MFRRRFLQLAAACIILPALRWVPVTTIEEELALTSQSISDLVTETLKDLGRMRWTEATTESYLDFEQLARNSL